MPVGTDWYPTSRPAQRAMYANILVKIDNHVPTIPLTAAQVTRLKLICFNYVTIYDWLEQSEATVGQMYEWRDEMENGDTSEPVSPPPVFQTITLEPGSFKGFVKEFREMVGLIKKLDGYTNGIGEDLMIFKPKGEGLNVNEAQPDFKYESKQPFKVRVTGSMQGFKTANFYYQRKGGETSVFVGYLGSLPAELTIAPAQAGVPEVGFIKAKFVDKNTEVGDFSTSTEITLS